MHMQLKVILAQRTIILKILRSSFPASAFICVSSTLGIYFTAHSRQIILNGWAKIIFKKH